MTTPRHIPVLLDVTVAAWFTRPDGRYVDCTGGMGGHTKALLNRLDSTAKVMVFDRDPQAIQTLRQEFSGEPRVTVEQTRFGEGDAILARYDWQQVDGIQADLGFSSVQLETGRGLSFRDENAPFDLRMSDDIPTAVDWLLSHSVEEIAHALDVGGDFRNSDRIANPLYSKASTGEVVTVGDALRAGFNDRIPPANVAARFLQAIRIAVNGEYEELDKLLQWSRRQLRAGGALAIITFHSGEAKRVKQEWKACDEPLDAIRMNTGKPYWKRSPLDGSTATAEELKRNPRSKPAVLRTAIREN